MADLEIEDIELRIKKEMIKLMSLKTFEIMIQEIKEFTE